MLTRPDKMKPFYQTHALCNPFQKFQPLLLPMLTSIVRGDQKYIYLYIYILPFPSLSHLWNRQLISAVNLEQVHLLCQLLFLKSQNTRFHPSTKLFVLGRSSRALLFIFHDSIEKLRDFSANLDHWDFRAKEFCNCVIFTRRNFSWRSNGLAG
jgi:hypothetical protein